MKKILVACLLVAGMSTGLVQAQKDLKLGYINSTELLSSLPETKAADSTLKQLDNSYRKSLQYEIEKYKEMMEAYKSGGDTLPNYIKAKREEEIMKKQEAIQKLDQEIPYLLQEKRQELYLPIIDKVTAIIKEVAKENGFTYIFEASQGAGLVFYDNGTNVMDLVKKKMESTSAVAPKN